MKSVGLAAAVLAIAEICHEANRAFCRTLGDNSQLPWNQAPEWQKESAKLGVEFRLQHPEAPASEMHNSWLRTKQNDGWVYGETKDPVAKTHPCIVPFEKLSLEQQTKDHLFSAVVDALRPMAQRVIDASKCDQAEPVPNGTQETNGTDGNLPEPPTVTPGEPTNEAPAPVQSPS